jgi:Transposase C of IS166 homeodomain
MSLATAELPADMVALGAFALACQSELKMAELSVQYKVQYKAPEIERLKLQIAKLRRMQFGRSSERITRQSGRNVVWVLACSATSCRRTCASSSVPSASVKPKGLSGNNRVAAAGL